MSEYETGRCIVGSKAHSADVGYLCTHHLDRLAANLRTVEEQAALLTAVPSFQQRTGNRGGSLASHRAPARLEVLVHNDPRHGTGRSEEDDDALAAGETLSILGTLGSWARLVREERQLSAPATVTISGERDLLSRNLSWIAAQEWIDEFEHDVRSLAGQLRAQNGTREDAPVGRCWHLADDGECGGTIRRATQESLPWIQHRDRCERVMRQTADGHAYCERCGCTWDGPQLATLNYELERAKRPKDENGEPLWSADEIAREHGVKVGTVAVWAHRRGIVSTGGYYDPRAFRRKAAA